MKPEHTSPSRYRSLLIIVLVWLALWFIPWGRIMQTETDPYLMFILDMIRLGLGLVTFLVPGVLFYWLLEQNSNDLVYKSGIFPIGFALSVFLIGTIGLIGRLAGLSFQTVKFLFVLTGVVEFVLLTLIAKRSSTLLAGFQLPVGWFKSYLPFLVVIFFSLLLTFHDELFFIDDRTYLAYITNWQYSSSLGFKNIIIESDVLELERFWLALYPMGQALLSDISGIPALLLLSNYLELYLVPLALIASYWFGRELGLSRKVSILSVLIQIALFSWMVGDEWPVGKWFFESMAEDKVSGVFLLAPVFFVFLLRYLDQPGRKKILLVMASGAALTLTHPVSLFFSCAIAAGLALASWITKRSGVKTFAVVVLVCVFLMAPYVIIRLIDHSTQTAFTLTTEQLSASYEVDRYVHIVSDIFYGFNPGMLLFFDIPPDSRAYREYQIFRFLPFALLIAAGILAWLRLKRGRFHRYMAVCISLILFGVIPYTGWILGYFTDARLIYRVTWYMPLGMSALLIMSSVDEWLRGRSLYGRLKNTAVYNLLNGYFLWLLVGFVIISPVVAFRTVTHFSKYFELIDHNSQLAKVGAYIDQHSTEPVISIGVDAMDAQLLPGVSAHTRVLSYREEKLDNGHNFFLTEEEILERKRASNVIRMVENYGTVEERCFLIRKYDVKFVIVPRETLGSYKQAVGPCEFQVTESFSTRGLVLLTIP